MTVTAESSQSNRRNLLLVDDDFLMPALLSKATNDSGYSMESTTNPSQLSTMDLEKFDVVILDLMMPKVDGIDVIAQLAASNYQARLPRYAAETREGGRAKAPVDEIPVQAI